jgi:hypothetical protein
MAPLFLEAEMSENAVRLRKLFAIDDAYKDILTAIHEAQESGIPEGVIKAKIEAFKMLSESGEIGGETVERAASPRAQRGRQNGVDSAATTEV